MSWQATAYVKSLRSCPDGTAITRSQKLLLFVLADYHNSAHRVAWPSQPLLCEEALCSRRQLFNDLVFLEKHGVIRRVVNLGRAGGSAYEFCGIDDQLKVAGKGAVKVAAQSTKSGKNEHRNKEERFEPRVENQASTETVSEVAIPQRPNLAWNGTEPAASWKAIQGKLRRVVNPHAYETWFERLRQIGVQGVLGSAGFELSVAVPDVCFLHLAGKYREVIVAAVVELALPIESVRFVARGQA